MPKCKHQQIRRRPSVPCVLNAAPSRNQARRVVAVLVALGSETAGVLATPSAITRGMRASGPAKVSLPRCEAYNVYALWRRSVINITAFAYVVNISRMASHVCMHSNDQDHDQSWCKQSRTHASHSLQHYRYVCFVSTTIGALASVRMYLCILHY